MIITFETIIKKIENEFSKILQLYQSVPIVDLVKPVLSNGWSVKDTLAHIAAWEWRCAFLLSQAHDTDAPLKARPDVVGLNREFYQERQNWSWTEVEADFCQAHHVLLEVIEQLPPGRLDNPLIQEAIAEQTWNHYAEHLTALKDWNRQLNTQSLLISWARSQQYPNKIGI